MGLEIGALMALSSMPFTKESPGKGRIVQQSFIFFFITLCFLANIASQN